MGRTYADGLVDSGISLEQGVTIHLTSNHYPPVPTSMVIPCIEAIYACADGDYERLIELPEGVTWRGNTSAPANAIAEAHHLDPFISDYADFKLEACDE
jgi:hypothetical protein